MKYVVSGHLSMALIERQIDHWHLMKRVWERCDIAPGDSLDTVVCKLYFRESNVANVCKAIREMGIAPTGFTAKSVTDIVQTCRLEDVELMYCVRALSSSNWKQAKLFA